MKKVYDHMIRQWQEKEMKSAVSRALLGGLERSYVHNEPKNSSDGKCDDEYFWTTPLISFFGNIDDAVVSLKTWTSTHAPQLLVVNSFIGATTKSFKNTPYVPLFKRPTEGKYN